MSKSRSKESPAALEIPTDVGRARFGLGHLSDPEEGLPLLVRMGLWGFGKENLNQITEESGQPVPEAFLALHRRRLKKQNLLTYTMDVGFAPDCIEYWVFHNPSLETGCVVGFDFKGVARNDAEIIMISECWFQSPNLASAQDLIFDLWERDFVNEQKCCFNYGTLQPGTLPLDRLRKTWHALFTDEEARANLGDDEITFEEFWEECMQG